MKKEVFSIASPFGEPYKLHKNYWGNKNFYETLTIVSGLQGDRLNSVWVASRLSHFLQNIEDGLETGYEFGGNIQIFPVLNFRALEFGSSVWGFDNLDFDYAFPGIEEGDLSEKICNILLQQSIDTHYGIVIQTGDHLYEEAPHIKLFNPNRNLKSLARCFGLNVARQIPDSPTLSLNLVKNWDTMGIPALLIVSGRNKILDPTYCDIIFEGLINFLIMTGFLIHKEEKGKKSEVAFYNPKCELAIKTNFPGLFIPEINVGSYIKVNQTIGKVIDIIEGRILEEIKAPEDGLLISLRYHPLIHEGEAIATLLTEKNRRWFWPFP